VGEALGNCSEELPFPAVGVVAYLRIVRHGEVVSRILRFILSTLPFQDVSTSEDLCELEITKMR